MFSRADTITAFNSRWEHTILYMNGIGRPSHLKMPGGPKMARAALSRQAMVWDGPCTVI